MRTVTYLATFALVTAVATATLADESTPAERAQRIGEQATRSLMQGLGGALMKALEDGGPVEAMAVCADTAQALTARIAAQNEVPGLVLKRTSLHLRNPANLPDSLEIAVLKDYAQRLAAGDVVEPRLAATEGAYRVFTPIETRGMCLQCHGPRDQLAEGVATILARRYPGDEATGHHVGDLRGIVSVTIPAAAVTD